MRLNAAAAAALTLLALSACGDDDDDDDGGTTPITSEMDGTWTGTATLTLGTAAPVTDVGEIDVAVSNTSATVTGICLDGTGSVDATGSGNDATWTGSLACPAVELGECASVVMTFSTVDLSLATATDTLTATGTGTAVGCDTSSNFTIELVATQLP